MPRRKKGNPVHGWVNFDKPLGMTSTQAVGKVRWLFGAQKAGHAGTLDPLATGIVPIALGEATKTMPFLVEAEKVYEAEIGWGTRTDTLDAEGEIVARSDVRPKTDALLSVLPRFTGEIEQIPPAFSAIKINGRRAYDLARAGDAPKMKARRVRIHAMEVIGNSERSAILRVRCGKGTYIRALARDIAHALGTEGNLDALRRTRVGPFSEDCAITLDALEQTCERGASLESLLGVETALDDIPVLAVTPDEQADLKHGRAILPHPSLLKPLLIGRADHLIGDIDASRLILAKCDGLPIALCESRAGQLRPKRVFNL